MPSLTRGVPLYIASRAACSAPMSWTPPITPVFHQCEALAVDKHLTMADLKGVLDISSPSPCSASEAKDAPAPELLPFTGAERRTSTCGSPTRRAAPAGSRSGAAAAW